MNSCILDWAIVDIEYYAFLVSIVSVVIAVVAVLRANEANRLSAEANRIATHYNLRPMRLNAFNTFKEFAHYCTTYRTLFLQGMVSGTRELMDRRDTFRKRLGELGPLDMPEIEAKALEFSNMAVQMQRALDRSRGSDPKPLDSKYPSIEENIDAIMDWFASEEKNLPSLFEKYLADA